MPRSILALALPAVLALATSCASNAARTQSSSHAETRVIPLKFVAASELEPVVRRAMGDGNLRVVADPRTNSLLLSGSSDAVASAQRVVATLDVEVKR